ncbi:MAG TPA: HEAT repeat domain-containing protein [Pirellulaceae bacterium]|jgi:HEAT repeat protein
MTALATTFRLLANTDNESATSVLIAALDSSHREVRDEALTAILERKSHTAELVLLRRWPELSERWKQQIADRPGWLFRAIRAAIVNGEPALFDIACSAAVFTRDYEAVPHLATAAIDRSHRSAAIAATAVLELAEQLAEELAAPRDYRSRRDPQLQRAQIIPALENAIEHTACPHAKKLCEALLLLANRDNAVLMRVLQSLTDPSHQLLTEIVLTSTRPVIEALLLSYLDHHHAPHSAIEIMARRADLAFIRQLTRKLAAGPTPTELINLRRIISIPWLREHVSLLDGLRENEQPGAVRLAVESGLPREQALDVLVYLARHGKLEARRLAAQSLAKFTGPVAAKLTVQLMQDDDPQVRAAAARQLRDRNIPGAIQRLTELLDSPHREERDAAVSSLNEFTFDHFSSIFDQLSPEAQTASGALVRRVDPQAVERIRGELTSKTRGKKQRAIELALALNAVDELHTQIAALLTDEDQYLRIEAIRALATHDSRVTRDALRDSLLDGHPLVREAAESSLADLTRRDTVKLAADTSRDTVPMADRHTAPPAPPAAVFAPRTQAPDEVLQ